MEYKWQTTLQTLKNSKVLHVPVYLHLLVKLTAVHNQQHKRTCKFHLYAKREKQQLLLLSKQRVLFKLIKGNMLNYNQVGISPRSISGSPKRITRVIPPPPPFKK